MMVLASFLRRSYTLLVSSTVQWLRARLWDKTAMFGPSLVTLGSRILIYKVEIRMELLTREKVVII